MRSMNPPLKYRVVTRPADSSDSNLEASDLANLETSDLANLEPSDVSLKVVVEWLGASLIYRL